MATRQGCSCSPPKTLNGLAESCWWQRGCGSLYCDTGNFNSGTTKEEMAPNKPHDPSTKRWSPYYTTSTSWEDRQFLFNGTRDVWANLRTFIPTFPSCSFSSVIEGAFLTIWGSREIPNNALKRFSKERTNTHQTLMNGQRRYCRKPTSRLQKYQEQKSEHQSQRKTFRTTGNG